MLRSIKEVQIRGSYWFNHESRTGFKGRAKEIGPIAGKIVAQVNKLSEDEQSAQMAKYHVEVKENKQKKEEGLQELPGSHDNVVMRFAPNPSGPLHI